MKYLRFLHENTIKQGFLEQDIVIEKKSNIEFNLQDIKLLAPCCPSKIVAVGLNYKEHAKELNMELPKEPLIFIKPVSSVIGHLDNIIYPEQSIQVDYEAELAIVIKNKIKNISENEVSENILGFTCLNDVTARDLQTKDTQWTRAKSFDTFCPIGPYIVNNIDPSNLKIESLLNDELKQSSNTSDFIFDINYIVSFISKIMTLYPEDIITTGTPAGIGPMNKGDKIEIRIENIGSLINYVV